MKKISLLIKNVKNFFIPEKSYCLICKKEGEGRLCKNCKKLLKSHPEICPICHKSSKYGQVCPTCQLTKNPPIEGIMIAFSYNQIIKKLIMSLKYYHKKDIAKYLAERLYYLLLTNELIEKDGNLLITYVPAHRIRKIFNKGYNQSEELAKNLAELGGFQFVNICKKTKNTKSQLALSRKDRLNNLNKAFKPKTGIKLTNKTIIIVDDLTTTGTTILKVAECIKSICTNCKIRGLVVARHNI